MPTEQQIQSALIKADAAGNAEDARQLANALKNIRTEKPEESRSLMDKAGEFAGGFNEIVPDILGAPMDAMNFIARGTGQSGTFPVAEPLQANIGTSGYFREITDKAKITNPEEQSTNFTKAGNYTSIGLSVMGGLKKLLGKKVFSAINKDTLTTAQRVGKKMTEPLINTPGRAIAIEAGGSAAAPVGGDIFAETFGEDYRIIGEFVGGSAGAVGTGASVAYGKQILPKIRIDLSKRIPVSVDSSNAYKLGKKIYYKGKGLFDPETRVARRLASVSEDVDSAVTNLSRNKSKLSKGVAETPASKTGDKHLMALEQEIINEDPGLYNLVSKNSTKNYGEVRSQIKSLYDDFGIEATQTELRKSADAQIALLDIGLEKARDKVNMAVTLLGPDADGPTINKVTRQIIDDVASKARSHEKQLWTKIVWDSPVAKDQRKVVTSALDELVEYLGKADISSNVFERSKPKNIQTLQGLKRLRTAIGNAAQMERSGQNPNFDKARVLNQYRDKVLDAMRVVDDSPELDAALAFSRDSSAKLNKGTVGRIRGYATDGGTKIDPELTLESTAGGMSRAKAGVVARDLSDIQTIGGKEMVDADPGIMVEQYTRDRLKIASSTGKVRVEALDSFVKNNKSLMDRFPNLRSQIKSAIDSEKGYADLSKEVAKLKSSPQLKFLEGLTDTTSDKFIRKILDTPNPQKSMALVLSKLSEKGKKGVRGAIFQFLESGASGKADDAGIRSIDGAQMKSIYRQHEKSFNAVLSKPERVRLIRLMNSLVESKFPKEGVPKVEGTMNDAVGYILRIPSRLIGAAAGTSNPLFKGGGAGMSLQKAQLGASAGERIYKSIYKDPAIRLMHDAVLDEKLYKDLLQYAAKIKIQTGGVKLPKVRVGSPLHGWMIAVGTEKIREE